MVLWLWVGGAITAFGAVLAAIPSRRRRGSEDRSGAPAGAPSGALTDLPDGSLAEAPHPDRDGPKDPAAPVPVPATAPAPAPVPAPVGAGAPS